jgi:hypothetical protein
MCNNNILGKSVQKHFNKKFFSERGRKYNWATATTSKTKKNLIALEFGSIQRSIDSIYSSW